MYGRRQPPPPHVPVHRSLAKGFRDIGNILRCEVETKRTICVILCICFIVFCMFLMMCGSIEPDFWARLYSMQKTKKPLIIMYTFSASLVILSLFNLIGLQQNNKTQILACVLVSLVFWQIHLMICIVGLVSHIIRLRGEFNNMSEILTFSPLLTFQGLWLYMISLSWYHWRDLSGQPDVPSFIRHLYLLYRRKKTTREDQRARFGNLPAKYMRQLMQPPRGIAMANAL